MKVTMWLISLCLAFGFSSYEGNTIREWKVSNNSTKTIQLDVKTGFGVDKIFVVESGNSEIISVVENRGGNNDAGNTADYFDLLDLINPIDSTRKDIKASSPWSVESEHVKRVPSLYEHRFSITITDQYF